MQYVLKIALALMAGFILWAGYTGIRGAVNLAHEVRKSRTDIRVEPSPVLKAEAKEQP